MRTVGSYLQEVRESKGISLDEAASVTRIGKNYLLAIEAESFDKLPNTAYIKGFLRVYAGYLGLSGDEIVAMYDESLISPQTQPSHDIDKDEPQRHGNAKTIPGRWLVPVLLLVAVIVAAYFVGDKEGKSGKDLPSVTPLPHVATLPAPLQAARSSVVQAPKPVTTMTDSRNNDAVATDGAPGTGIILRLKVNQDCALNITIDNTVSQQYDLKSGDLIEWKGEKVFVLDIGNAGGLEGEFNGKPLKPFGDPGKSAHVILTREGT